MVNYLLKSDLLVRVREQIAFWTWYIWRRKKISQGFCCSTPNKKSCKHKFEDLEKSVKLRYGRSGYIAHQCWDSQPVINP